MIENHDDSSHKPLLITSCDGSHIDLSEDEQRLFFARIMDNSDDGGQENTQEDQTD